MKKIYFLFAFLFSLSSFSQSELIGEWFLESINHNNGIQLDNYLNNNPHILNLNFNQLSEDSSSILFNIEGLSSCNGFVGEYNIDNTNTITINSFSALTGSCEGQPQSLYESMYLEIIGDFITSNNILTYQIAGAGANQILTINHPNGNSAVYSKSPTTISLFSTWYLYSIESDTEIITISSTDSPILNLTTNTDVFSKVSLDGIGDCNGFSAFYNIYSNNDTTFLITEFLATLSVCPSGSNSFEQIYFSILSNETTNLLSYEIIDNGQTLILTNLIGEKLIYGRQALSIDESIFNNSSISLVKNPVNEVITLSFFEGLTTELKYSIISINGKIITKTQALDGDEINIRSLNSGIYFLKITSTDNRNKVLKFIKN